ncbi:MAG: hypothetical protein ACI9FB_002879 [Candidatus Azotimanducaceae bacterium]|jgi:hypothetical protein
MKFKILVISVIISSSIVAATAAPGPDFSKIRKDLNVMSQVVRGAFNGNDSCKGCSVKVATNYLAKQGAVFTVSTFLDQRSHSSSFSYSNDGDNTFIINDSTFDRLAPLAELDALEALEALENLEDIIAVPDITDMVGSILVEVGASLGEAGANMELFDNEGWEVNGSEHSPHIRIDRSTRRASRELSREVRDIEYEIRELDIELLHADDSDEQKDIEKRMVELEKKKSKSEVKRDEFHAKQKAKEAELTKKRNIQRLKSKQENDKLLENVQNIVLQSFCDYGGTLKHLPKEEKVSVVFNYVRTDKDTIFVLEKDDISDCTSAKELKSTALTYLF